MRKLVLVLAITFLLVYMPGCTQSKAKPSPNNPEGDILDAKTAGGLAKDFLSQRYSGSNVVVPFTITRRMLGEPAAWSGNNSGNSTLWTMYLEGIMQDLDTIRHISIAVGARYRDGNVTYASATPNVKVVKREALNQTYDSIVAASLDPYILKFSSQDIFLAAEPARPPQPENTYLQSVSISLYQNSTSPVSGIAAWTVKWKYYTNDTYEPVTSTVILNAYDAKVLRTE